ncbi:MAG TPA: tetratricopeptide repeat protein [Thermoanaerobaculia bacterium]|nr:tetratricopeptide repeat protein [Thermoanaerobaculia bacterium]
MKTAPLLAVALLILAGARQVQATSLYTGVERAIALRDPGRLAEYRSVLKREIDLLGGKTPGDLRAYTLAYVSSRLSPILPEDRKAERLRLLREAEASLQQYLRVNPRDPEAHALLGAVYGAQIRFTPLKAVTLGPRIADAFAEAEKLGPRNPRVALQKGIGLLHVPRAFGGGAEAAERELRRAEGLFAQEPETKAWPNWGRLDVLIWLGQALARQGDREAARAVYRRALEMEPESTWVRQVLLPQLDRP